MGAGAGRRGGLEKKHGGDVGHEQGQRGNTPGIELSNPPKHGLSSGGAEYASGGPVNKEYLRLML